MATKARLAAHNARNAAALRDAGSPLAPILRDLARTVDSLDLDAGKLAEEWRRAPAQRKRWLRGEWLRVAECLDRLERNPYLADGGHVDTGAEETR